MNIKYLVRLLSLALFICHMPLWGKDLPLVSLASSVVKISVSSQHHSYSYPWQAPRQQHGHGSGVVIDGQRVLTNAHVVSNSVYIEVKLASYPKPFAAQVEHVAHECDLAILKVIDPSFFSHAKSVPLGELAPSQSKIAVVGYPTGGEDLSITKGIISRTEVATYVHSQSSLLLQQTDAAINPGNSGGPALSKDGKVVGVAFQGSPSLQGTGYLIPMPIVKYFLKTVKKARFQGFPTPGLYTQQIKNPYFKKYYGLSEKQEGLLITKILPTASIKTDLQIGDVIVSIDGREIGPDGKYQYNKKLRVSIQHLIQSKPLGAKIKVQFIRQKKPMTKTLTLDQTVQDHRLVPLVEYDKKPRYFIYGGLVFQPLTENYLREWGNDWSYVTPKKMMVAYEEGAQTLQKKEIVVLNQVLPHKISEGYHTVHNVLVHKVNNISVQSLSHLMGLLEKTTQKTVVITTSEGEKIILDRAQVKKNAPEILQKFSITQDRFISVS